jgi:hypothetical protein
MLSAATVGQEAWTGRGADHRQTFELANDAAKALRPETSVVTREMRAQRNDVQRDQSYPGSSDDAVFALASATYAECQPGYRSYGSVAASWFLRVRTNHPRAPPRRLLLA